MDRKTLRQEWKDEETWRRHEIIGRLNAIGRTTDRTLVRRMLELIEQVVTQLPKK